MQGVLSCKLQVCQLRMRLLLQLQHLQQHASNVVITRPALCMCPHVAVPHPLLKGPCQVLQLLVVIALYRLQLCPLLLVHLGLHAGQYLQALLGPADPCSTPGSMYVVIKGSCCRAGRGSRL